MILAQNVTVAQAEGVITPADGGAPQPTQLVMLSVGLGAAGQLDIALTPEMAKIVGPGMVQAASPLTLPGDGGNNGVPIL